MANPVDEDLMVILQNSSLNPEARTKGWEFLLSLTVTDDGFMHIIEYEKYIPFMLSYIETKESEKEQCELAYKCLINISNREKGALALISAKNECIDALLTKIAGDEKSVFVRHKCYILSNLSASQELLQQIVQIFSSHKELLANLVKCFVTPDDEMRKKYDFLALVFANVTRLSDGRRLFLDDGTHLLKDFFTFLNPKEPEVRRLGVAIMLRNCCYERGHHKLLLDVLQILPCLLLPLMGPEEYDESEMDELPLECQYLENTKERDPSAQVRKILVHTLTGLCYTEYGWNYLKSKGVYYVARDLHKWDSDSGVVEGIEDLVAYLLIDQYTDPKPEGAACSEELLSLEMPDTHAIMDLPDFVI